MVSSLGAIFAINAPLPDKPVGVGLQGDWIDQLPYPDVLGEDLYCQCPGDIAAKIDGLLRQGGDDATTHVA